MRDCDVSACRDAAEGSGSAISQRTPDGWARLVLGIDLATDTCVLPFFVSRCWLPAFFSGAQSVKRSGGSNRPPRLPKQRWQKSTKKRTN